MAVLNDKLHLYKKPKSPKKLTFLTPFSIFLAPKLNNSFDNTSSNPKNVFATILKSLLSLIIIVKNTLFLNQLTMKT